MPVPSNRLRFDLPDPDLIAILARKSGAERLAIAAAMFRAARRMLASELAVSYPEWSEPEVEREVARRIAGGAG